MMYDGPGGPLRSARRFDPYRSMVDVTDGEADRRDVVAPSNPDGRRGRSTPPSGHIDVSIGSAGSAAQSSNEPS